MRPIEVTMQVCFLVERAQGMQVVSHPAAVDGIKVAEAVAAYINNIV